MTDSNFYKGSRPPIVKPIDLCQRGLYETGRPPSGPAAGGGDAPNFNTPRLPTKLWENLAPVSSQPGWLMFMLTTFLETWNLPGYVLFFDLNPSDPNQLQLVTANAVARYTFGPVPAASGGTLIYESTAESIPLVQPHHSPWAYGLPFNFGIIAAASSTPRRLTAPDIDTGVMSLTARVQT